MARDAIAQGARGELFVTASKWTNSPREVAQAEVEAALGKVVSLAGYRDLLRGAGGKKQNDGKGRVELDLGLV